MTTTVKLNAGTVRDTYVGNMLSLNSHKKMSYFHLGESERVVLSFPGSPFHAVSVRLVTTSQVGAVQVGRVAVTVPPGTFECYCTRA